MKSSIAGLVSFIALGLLVVAHYLGLAWTVGAGVALAAVFGFGWPHYLGIPAKKTLGTIITLTGAGSALTAGLYVGADYLMWTPILIAVGFAGVLVVQLIRGTGQRHRLESTFGAGAGVAIAGLVGGWVASLRFLGEPSLTLMVAISAAAAIGVGMLPWPDRVLAPLSIVMAALSGSLAALVFTEGRLVQAALLGILLGAVLAAFRRLRTLSRTPVQRVGVAAAGLAPILSLGALVYFVEKILLH